MYKIDGLIPDWNTLRLLLVIDRHGGVAGAARALGTTHATISRRLSRAETEAGIAFFDRLPAGLRLTPAGRAVLDHATRIEPEIDALERQLARHEDSMTGPLRLTLPPLMMTPELARDITDFTQRHPGITPEVLGDNTLRNLHRREAEVALRVSHKPPKTLWGRKLTDQSAAFYAATDLLAQLDGAAPVPVISFSSWAVPIPDAVMALYPKAYVAARCDDMSVAINLVRAGTGITRMPRLIGEVTPGITRLTALPWSPYFPVWLLTHPDLRHVPRIEAFMRHIARRISKRRTLYCVTPTG